MGGILGGGPSIPAPDPELAKQRAEEKARLEKEKADEARRQADEQRKKDANLKGARSLQDEEISGFGGFRSMGGTNKAGSIRN